MGVIRCERRSLWTRIGTAACVLALGLQGTAFALPPFLPVQSAAPASARAAAPAPGAPAAPAQAAATSAAAPKLSPAAALKAATQGLASANAGEVRTALLALAELRGDAAARVLAKRMHAGLPPALIGDAIDVAVQLGSQRPVPELLELAQHKRPEVRQHALSALAALKAKSAQGAVMAALDDPNAEVRRAAIDALASVGSARALPALLALVERGQPGALQAVGKLAAARDLAGLLAHAPGGDVTPFKPALQGWLQSAPRMPAQQLELIAALTKVASPSARTYLVEWLDAAKSSGNARVRQALFGAIKQLDQGAEVASVKTTRTTVQGAQVIARVEAPAPAAGTAVATEAAPAANREGTR